MGSLDESNQTSTTNNGNEAIVDPTIAHDEPVQFGSNKKLLSFTSCSSSTSSDFSLEDLIPVLDGEHDQSSLKLETDDQLATEHDEKPNEVSPNDYISESPSIQVMEHPEVFARKKSNTPGEWRMGSNESLFSINQSFILKSGDPGLVYGVEASTSSPGFNSPYHSQFVDKNHESGEVNNQGSNDKEKRLSTADEQPSHVTAASSSSNSSQSFAFPILAGETEKGGSPDPRGSLSQVPYSPLKPEPPSKPEPSAVTEETQKATPLIAWTKWFPCIRYCA